MKINKSNKNEVKSSAHSKHNLQNYFDKNRQFISQACCFTMHRENQVKKLRFLKEALEEALTNVVYRGCRYFGIGGALGFDTLAAQTVLLLKKTFLRIRLILVLLCETQTRGYSETDKLIYDKIKGSADKVVYTLKTY